MLFKVEHLCKEYENATPLKDVNCEINKGEVITVIGPSGTGKSTLAKCLNLLEEPTSGKIYYNGQDILAHKFDRDLFREKVGMVFQSFNLFQNLTVAENIMLAPINLLKMDKQAAYDKAIELLSSVGLADKAQSYPSELSGGQQQRIAIVRAVAMNPEVILFDEPTSALDPTMIGEVLLVINNLKKQGMTMLIVTHEMNFAKEISDRVFFMCDGIVYEQGSPDQIFNHPQKEKTRQFINRLKVFNWQFEKNSFDFYGMNNEINNYCQNHLIPKDLTNKILTIAEELGVQTVLPLLNKESKASLSLEFDDKVTNAKITIKYSGERIDPTGSNELAYKIVNHLSEPIRYEYNEDEKENILIASIKTRK